METNKKKFLYLGMTLLFLIAVVGISYAAYTFIGTGTTENVITTGQINVSFNEKNNILISNRYPETDTAGLANTDPNSQMTFTVSSNIVGDGIVDYAVGIVEMEEGTTLTQEDIKIYLEKNGTTAQGFTTGSGQTIESFKDTKVEGFLDSHVITQGSLARKAMDTYDLKAWVNETYKLPKDESMATDENGGYVTTISEQFSFKLKVVATDLHTYTGTKELPKPNAPELATNMIPVTYDSENNTWVKADKLNTGLTWYDYEEKRWANAVTVVENNYYIDTTKNNQSVNVSRGLISKTYYKSTNYNLTSSSSSSIFTFTAGSSGTYSFDWSVSSERFDKLTIKVNGTAISDVNGIYGVKSGTYTAEAISGKIYTIEVLYAKNATLNSNDDTATIGNFILPEGSTEITNTVNDTYPKYPWESYNIITYTYPIYNTYKIDDYKFVLLNPITTDDIGGKYVCADINSNICSELYEIVEYNDEEITKVNKYSDIKVSITREEIMNTPVGTPIPMEAINSMLVWIPRFSAEGSKLEVNLDLVDEMAEVQVLNGYFDSKEDAITNFYEMVEVNNIEGVRNFIQSSAYYVVLMSLDDNVTLSEEDNEEIINNYGQEEYDYDKLSMIYNYVNNPTSTIVITEEMIQNGYSGTAGTYNVSEVQNNIYDYVYKMQQKYVDENFDGHEYNDGTQEAPGAFNITFVNKDTPAHDAFTFGEQNLSGFWIGKFENSSDIKCSPKGLSSAVGEGCNLTTIRPKVLPNVSSWIGANISTQFYNILNMTENGNQYGFDKTINTTLDVHMLKNNEWGAVAYLTQSIYGRCTSSTSCTEVGVNNNGAYVSGVDIIYTGYGAPAGSHYSDYYSSYVTPQPYNTEQGMDASTTGNIYGVYDMSGGTEEYVMGNANNKIEKAEFNALPETKYYNLYTTESEYSNLGLQHGMYETSGWFVDQHAEFGYYNPWSARGGDYADGYNNYAGVFAYNFSSGGGGSPYHGSRISITND